MKRFAVWFLAFLLVAAAYPVHADVEVGELSTVVDSFKVGIDLHTFYRVDSSPYFGGSRPRADNPDDTIKDAHWGEIFTKLRFTAGKDLGWVELLGQVAPYYAQTVDQDVYGLSKDETDFNVDQAWIEFAKIANSPFSVRVGRQDIQIEKWFLVADGSSQDAAHWLEYRYSFPFGVQVQADLSPVQATAFWARSGIRTGDPFEFTGTVRENGDVDLVGLNLHYDFAEGTYLYGGYFRTFDESDDQNNDLNVWDLGGQATLLGSLVLEGEFAYQTGDAGSLDVSAQAWWASAAYTFPVRYAPYVRGTYVSYSGDEDPADGDLEAWNPFFTGFVGWNRWVQGEQTSEVWLGQSNKRVAIGEVGFSPLEGLGVSLMYLNHTLDEKDSTDFGALRSDDWGDEVNLFVDYSVNEHLFTHFGTGFVKPGDAAEEVNGDDKTAIFAQIWLSFYL